MAIIRHAGIEDAAKVARLAHMLWPEVEENVLSDEFNKSVVNPRESVFTAVVDNEIIAFTHCTLRTDYVEGTESSPVGYLEAVFVLPEYRRCGVARQLVHYSEKWALSKGCTEFASDCEFTNKDSYDFHLRLGFKEANRIICFTKQLGETAR